MPDPRLPTKIPMRLRLAKKDAVVCFKCGRIDLTEWRMIKDRPLLHVGTSKKMRCPDCNNGGAGDFASLCRYCCPTCHGTELYVQHVVEKFVTVLSQEEGCGDVEGNFERDLTEALRQDLQANHELKLEFWDNIENVEDMLFAPLTPATEENLFKPWPNVDKAIYNFLK